MSIIVVCTECKKSFNVSDKFAGRSGPCPNCKHVLRVPEKSEEVKVHVPEQFAGGGRSKSGKLVTKPIARINAKFQPVTTAVIVASTLAVFAITWIGGRSHLFENTFIAAIGLLAVSPFLAVGAYEVLRDDELEPYRGVPLYIRAAICGTAYVLLWGIFAMLSARGMITGDMWNWMMVLPPLVVGGGLVATAALDLEFGNAMFHYGFYLLVTLILRWAAGMKWIWDI